MKYLIREKISNSDKLMRNYIECVVTSDKIRNMIHNRERQYCKKLDLYYYVTDAYTQENFVEKCLEVRIAIEIDSNSNPNKEVLVVDTKELFNNTFTSTL